MTFVSLLNKHKTRKTNSPFVKFRKTASGSTGGCFNKSVQLHGKSVDIEIDYESKKLRISEHPEGYCVAKKVGTFSCSSLVFDEVGNERIYLTLGDDGWWYGSYGKGDNHG